MTICKKSIKRFLAQLRKYSAHHPTTNLGRNNGSWQQEFDAGCPFEPNDILYSKSAD